MMAWAEIQTDLGIAKLVQMKSWYMSIFSHNPILLQIEKSRHAQVDELKVPVIVSQWNIP